MTRLEMSLKAFNLLVERQANALRTTWATLNLPERNRHPPPDYDCGAETAKALEKFIAVLHAQIAEYEAIRAERDVVAEKLLAEQKATRGGM